MYLTKSLKTNVIHLLKKKNFFKGATKDGIMFKNVLEYCQFFFWTNEGCISNTFIIIVKKDGDLISNKKEPVELFNQNCINIVENSSGKKPLSLGDSLNTSHNELISKILYQYIVTILAFKK